MKVSRFFKTILLSLSVCAAFLAPHAFADEQKYMDEYKRLKSESQASLKSAKEDLKKALRLNKKAKDDSTVVNVNTAKMKTLAKKLKGIGLVKAASIVAYRKTFGDFESMEDLAKVKGVGKSILDKNKDIIVFE